MGLTPERIWVSYRQTGCFDPVQGRQNDAPANMTNQILRQNRIKKFPDT